VQKKIESIERVIDCNCCGGIGEKNCRWCGQELTGRAEARRLRRNTLTLHGAGIPGWGVGVGLGLGIGVFWVEGGHGTVD